MVEKSEIIAAIQFVVTTRHRLDQLRNYGK